MLVPKSRGAGIMVSDFISEQDGYLKLTDEEITQGKEKYPQYGRRSIEYGENRDGYWTSERFMEQLTDWDTKLFLCLTTRVVMVHTQTTLS